MEEQKQDEELQEEISEIEEAAEQPQEVQETVEEVVEEPVETAVQQEIPPKLAGQPKQIGAPVPGRLDRLKAFIMECRRVLRVTKKPDKQEYLTIVKISSIGMAIIGVVGFLVHFAKELLFK